MAKHEHDAIELQLASTGDTEVLALFRAEIDREIARVLFSPVGSDAPSSATALRHHLDREMERFRALGWLA